MIPAIGLMIGAYCIVKLLGMIMETDEHFARRTFLVFAGVIAIIVIITCIMDIYTAAGSVQSAMDAIK